MVTSSRACQDQQSAYAVDPSVVKFFRRLKDPRRRHRRLHRLQDIIFIALCAAIAGSQDWQDVVTFAKHRLTWLKRFFELPNGIPSHDTFERVFDLLDPTAFQACFREWVEAVSALLKIEHVAIDGKTLRGSGSGKHGPLHLVSAWASAQHLSLGQVAVSDKSNEITAIPLLLEMLDLNGALVTIDAMGCQKKIAAKIIERGGHYALSVKENQEHLLEDIQEQFAQALDQDLAGLDHDAYETESRGHGRIERRSYLVIHSTQGIRQAEEWPGLTTIGFCNTERTVNGTTTMEASYFIGSKKTGAKYYGMGRRHHWGIENSLHWQLDVSMKEDGNRVSKRNAAENLGLLRRLTVTLLQAHPSSLSIAKKRYAATLNPDFLEEILSGEGILEKA